MEITDPDNLPLRLLDGSGTVILSQTDSVPFFNYIPNFVEMQIGHNKGFFSRLIGE